VYLPHALRGACRDVYRRGKEERGTGQKDSIDVSVDIKRLFLTSVIRKKDLDKTNVATKWTPQLNALLSFLLI
jgi:hypothetical protein